MNEYKEAVMFCENQDYRGFTVTHACTMVYKLHC